jgi:imidazole glycerol-phosphate synthase subunit HisH
VIAVVDVCSGNLRSVERAIAQVGGDVVVTRDAEVVRRADKVVVPGQGAFGMFMRGLAERGLGDVLRGAIASGRPYLGICLGMQVLFDESEEQGPCPGLGVLPGRVVRMHPADRRLKVPHIGWNQVGVRRPDPLLAGVAEGAYVYFDHSYHAVPADPSMIALDTEHGDRMTAAVRRDNIFACQFHPEKSQSVGLQMLRNFVERA